jgi:predicted lactoylglutathione lyase
VRKSDSDLSQMALQSIHHQESWSRRALSDSFCYDKAMKDNIVINLPVANMKNSEDFFNSINFKKNLELSDENAVCFYINAATTIALLPNDNFTQATKGMVANTASEHEVLISICKSSEDSVNHLVDTALSAGAIELGEPIRARQLYGRTFSDLDGHQWNIFCSI